MFEETIIDEDILYRDFEFDDFNNKENESNNEESGFSEDILVEDEDNTLPQLPSITSYFPLQEASTKLTNPKTKKKKLGDGISEQCKTTFKPSTSTSSIAAHIRTEHRIFKHQK
ncbi:5136_t:CDS:2 [Ambispora leptoticha]|uniref:5136_t:CDS:1 n=1 Tax=Ambispora leptoticha TaxID=144679 RepID=A0A9N9H9A3_9GLOM|nr:5136_t:CDS:2 [Ambispora leptoticha]